MQHVIKSLIQVDRAKAVGEVRAAFRKAGCHRRDAASSLGVSYHTFLRWVAELELTAEFAELEVTAKKEGWHHGNVGGAGMHRDPGERVKRSRATRAKKKEPPPPPAPPAKKKRPRKVAE